LNLEAVSSSDAFVLYGLASKTSVILHFLPPNGATDQTAHDPQYLDFSNLFINIW